MSDGLHPLVAAAGRGRLPPWAEARDRRRDHMARVAELLRRWAVARGEPADEVTRWAAAGYLHDALRDADPERLRQGVPEALADLPAKVLHGPAAAERMRREGVRDDELLEAVAYHTLGSPDFGTLGRSLYAADFLEPGRRFRPRWRARLRRRLPDELEAVVLEILAARLAHLVEQRRPVRPETMRFWNSMVDGRPWASASEV